MDVRRTPEEDRCRRVLVRLAHAYSAGDGNGPLDVTNKIHCPVLGLYAGADQGIPLEHVERLRAGLLAFGKDKSCPIIVYPDVPHGFHADYRPTYRKAEAEDGWETDAGLVQEKRSCINKKGERKLPFLFQESKN